MTRDRRKRRIPNLVAAMLTCAAASAPAADYAQGANPAGVSVVDRAPSAARAAMKALAGDRTGYVVWESRRPSGTANAKYRIWKRSLHGGGLAMISGAAGEANYAHLGPKISPNGRHVIFAGKKWNSYFDETTRTIYNGEYAVPPFDAWIVDIDSHTLEAGTPRELTALRGRVGTAGEDHFFEWKTNRIVYVPIVGQNAVFEFDIVSGEIGRTALANVRGERVLSPSGAFEICAQGGGAGFGTVNTSDDAAAPPGRFKRLGGCQVSISSADDWLVWMSRAAMISRYNIETGRRAEMRGLKNALPRGHNYMYFPALSRDRSLIAFGGSDIHSHAYGDYEIFVARLNPESFDHAGPPVRYTFNDRRAYPGADRKAGTVLDRWPDVWVSNPETNGESDGGVAFHKVNAGPGPLEGLTSTILAYDLKRLARARSYGMIMRTLKRYARDGGNPERAREATRILKHLDDWATAALARADALVEVSPGAAFDLYEEVKDKFYGRRQGTAAQKHIDTLESDTEIARQLRAWDVFRYMRTEAARFRTPKGAKPSGDDARFAAANRSRIMNIVRYFKRLQRNFPDTRAMLEARSLTSRYDIDVPAPVPALAVTVAEVEATVVQTSAPLRRERIAPYTEALITTRYEVKRVLFGELKATHVLAIQLAMQDGKPLPAAGFKRGETYRLKLGSWAAQKHYHSHPIADDIEDYDTEPHFVFEAKKVP